MLARRTYYSLKPFVPWSLRMVFRRWYATMIRRGYQHDWPVSPSVGNVPKGWPGWPDGKRFAFVLTHDVEGSKGLERCRQLMDMEQAVGFRSSFNFVPEGGYTTPPELRALLGKSGFEVGVHDLKHDGKLYDSEEAFKSHARKINQYVKEWDAVGFRSGFMHHNLDWLHELNVLYDGSTFDMDPFEPQPDGVHTIFPFWVPGRNGEGYVELPYTLTQDFTLFVTLKERTINIWKRKLDWIVERGGMALVNVHPDYMCFNGRVRPNEFPAERYREFLQYVRDRYQGDYWAALPRDVARYAHGVRHSVSCAPRATASSSRKIWIDLDNTPHVPFFHPIIRELEDRGYQVVLTARDAFQVCELASHHGLSYMRIGHHYGKNRLRKVAGLVLRAAQLLPFVVQHKPLIGLSHGARSQILLCNLMRIPTVLIIDYEHSKSPPLARPRWEIAPDSLALDKLYAHKDRVRQYPGIKEDVYAPEFKADPRIMKQLGLAPGDLVITVRPPATEAHYHNPESELLFVKVMERIVRTPDAKGILLPRNRKQASEIQSRWPQWFEQSKVIIPNTVVDGLNLIWHSDLVISGGGTMNREAAALDVPVYSIFRGPMGAVDRRLQEEGRLVMVETADGVEKISFTKRSKEAQPDNNPRRALKRIVDHIEEIIRTEYPSLTQ